METGEENISFDNVLDSLDADWEILDDSEGSIGFSSKETVVEDTKETEEEEEEVVIDEEESEEVKDTSFDNEFDTDTKDETVTVEDEEEESEEGIFSYLGETLIEKGIMSGEEGAEYKSEEDIYSGIESTIKNGIESWKSSLGDESLKYINYLENGGDSTKYIETNAVTDYSNIDLTEDDAKKSIVSAFYKDKGFSDKKITKLIENAEDMEDLTEEATEAQSYFKEKKEKTQGDLIAAQEAQNQQKEQDQKDFVTNLEKYVGEKEDVRNFPLKTKNQKKEILSYIFDKTVPFKQNDGTVVKISEYMSEKLKRNADKNSKLEDIIFDALVQKHGSAPISKKTITDRNRKMADMANKHKNKNTSAKLSGSGGKTRKPRENNNTHSFDKSDWDTI